MQQALRLVPLDWISARQGSHSLLRRSLWSTLTGAEVTGWLCRFGPVSRRREPMGTCGFDAGWGYGAGGRDQLVSAMETPGIRNRWAASWFDDSSTLR